uniref:Uncharacterized protein n=1 Tax=Timema cristinae TaxID=61476 RepID=A0A7R9D191_TIMCR|nr:unnamed protein product [Timema cristinae]
MTDMLTTELRVEQLNGALDRTTGDGKIKARIPGVRYGSVTNWHHNEGRNKLVPKPGARYITLQLSSQLGASVEGCYKLASQDSVGKMSDINSLNRKRGVYRRNFTKGTTSLKALLDMEDMDIITIQGKYRLLEEKANLLHSLDQEIFQHLIETEATEKDLINEVEVVDDYKRDISVENLCELYVLDISDPVLRKTKDEAKVATIELFLQTACINDESRTRGKDSPQSADKHDGPSSVFAMAVFCIQGSDGDTSGARTIKPRIQLVSTSFALTDTFGTGEPINSRNQPSQISAHAHLTTHALYSQKKLADSFIGRCEEI